jgi:hypothetical protein
MVLSGNSWRERALLVNSGDVNRSLPKHCDPEIYWSVWDETPHHIILNSLFHDDGDGAKILLVSLLHIWSWMHIME